MTSINILRRDFLASSLIGAVGLGLSGVAGGGAQAAVPADDTVGGAVDSTAIRPFSFHASSEQLADFFNVTGGGLLVTEVRPGGLIERAGIRAGDCIKGVNGEPVSSAQDLSRQINHLARGDGAGKAAEVVFALIRDRHEVELKTSLGDK